MPHSFLNGHDISACLIQMKSKSVAEAVKCVACLRKTEEREPLFKRVINRLLMNMGIGFLTRKESVLLFCRGMKCANVNNKQLKSLFRKNSIPVGAVLTSGYVNAMFGMIDITAFQAC